MLQTRDPKHTRQRLLRSALTQMHKSGFGAASLSDILGGTGLTRGALYHHFDDKRALGLAAVELIEQEVRQMWLEPLEGSLDPISDLQALMERIGAGLTQEDIVLGCPLNNLAQEMSASDDEFRLKVKGVYDTWRRGLAQVFGWGQQAGTVSPQVDTLAAATFFVAALAGGRGLAKTSQSPEILESLAGTLSRWLESLRP